MKKVIASFLILFLPLCLLLVGVNYFVDPANIFHAVRFVDEVYNITVSGKNADGVSNYADRLFVEKRIGAMDETPEVMVYGSSRSAQIDSLIAGADCFNASVSGATLEDAVSIYEICRTNKLTPRRVVLCVEPWYFDGNKKDARYGLYLSKYYESFITRNIDAAYEYTGESLVESSAKELFSLEYFQTSVNSIFKSTTKTYKLPVATDKTETNAGMIKSDGSFVYPNSYLRASDSDILLRKETATEGIIFSLRDSGGIDSEKLAVFEALVSDILSDGSSLTILISPYDPVVYAEIEAEPGAYKNLTDIELYLNRLCGDTGASLVGSYNPENCGLNSVSFIDALHITYDETYSLFHGKI